MAEPAGWRGIDELAALVGRYSWLERRLFELTGRWATSPATEGAAPHTLGDELRVWCAAASRRHGELAGRWAQRLPVRAGVDAGAFVAAPPGPLAGAFEALEAEGDAGGGLAVLVTNVLPWLAGVYLAHSGAASPVSEAPVAEVLMEARRVVEGEIQSGRTLRQMAGDVALVRPRTIVTVFDQAFEETCVFPAVYPS